MVTCKKTSNDNSVLRRYVKYIVQYNIVQYNIQYKLNLLAHWQFNGHMQKDFNWQLSAKEICKGYYLGKGVVLLDFTLPGKKTKKFNAAIHIYLTENVYLRNTVIWCHWLVYSFVSSYSWQTQWPADERPHMPEKYHIPGRCGLYWLSEYQTLLVFSVRYLVCVCVCVWSIVLWCLCRMW